MKHNDPASKTPIITDRVRFGPKLAWGVGGIADFLMANTIVYLAMPIYNIGLGVSAMLVGLALGLPRIFDAITDPFMGNISDNTRSRWGRRRPYILLGAVLSGVMYAIIWLTPSGLGETGMFVYLLITSMIFFLTYTIFMVPHGSLAFEMSTDTHERTNIMAFRTFFFAVTSLFIPWIYWLTRRPIFGGDEVIGIRYVGVLVGLVIIGFGILPAIFCREKADVQSQPKIPFLHAAKITALNRPFLHVAGILTISLISINLIIPFNMYLNIYYIFDGDKDMAAKLFGVGMTTGNLLAIVALWPITYISARIGKKTSLFIGELCILLAFLSSFVVYTPNLPYLQLISTGLYGLGLQWICLITLSMLSDVCDLDDVRTGLRREGMYTAMFGFTVKAGIGGAGVLSGLMLSISGYDPAVIPTADTILKMRLLYALVPSVFLLTAMYLNYIYPLNDRRMRTIRKILDTRKIRGAVGPEGS